MKEKNINKDGNIEVENTLKDVNNKIERYKKINERNKIIIICLIVLIIVVSILAILTKIF